MSKSKVNTCKGKIAVLGAESSGKSTLCLALESPNRTYLPEHLREFCLQHKRTPLREEQQAIMDEQIAKEKRFQEQTDGYVLCDSTPLQTAIYSQLLFDDTRLIKRAVAHQLGYSLALLCATDFPWQADNADFMRDGPQQRQLFQSCLIECLKAHALPYVVLEGSIERRVHTALSAILELSR